MTSFHFAVRYMWSWSGRCAFLGCAALWLAVIWTEAPAKADGIFVAPEWVWVWDKQVDINEPTQKAILVYGDGEEDMLLQVRYEGPVAEFGWLVPVPSLPKVEQGSMGPFYELSRLTQERYGGLQEVQVPVVSAGPEDESPAVKVVEVKTVGAYEVAVLSARDAGNLEKWLKEHDYSLPKNQKGIIDEYIRNNWFFVAAKINLHDKVGLRMVSDSGANGDGSPIHTEESIQRQLAKGELHPLLIHFATSNCVFPLRISAVLGKPSVVSLYVLSQEPLLDEFIFKKAVHAFRQQIEEQAQTGELVECMAVGPGQIPECAGAIPRLTKGKWFLTHQAYSFRPEWMHDLRFVKAAALLQASLPNPEGPAAARVLRECGEAGIAALLTACKSSRAQQRIAASSSLQSIRLLRDDRLVDFLTPLFKDEQPQVRSNAMKIAGMNWDARFSESLVMLFHDPDPQLRTWAAELLCQYKQTNRAGVYVPLLNSPDTNVQRCAFRVLSTIKPNAIPRELK